MISFVRFHVARSTFVLQNEKKANKENEIASYNNIESKKWIKVKGMGKS